MARLLFCDYHNMVAILEKGEHNTDFHPMVDFLEASPLRYALTVKPTVYVSHLRQFWSTARIETTEEGAKILATVDGIVRTVSESSLRRNLKLRDEEGISSLPDAELFENLTLMGYNISPNQKFTFQKGQFSHQWKYLIHTIMQCLSPKSIGFNEFSSNISTALVCLATNRTCNFSKMIFNGLVKNVNNKVLKFLMYPRFLSMCLRMSQFGQITHTQTYVVPFHTKKLFTTLRVNSPSFFDRIFPLFDAMLVLQGEGSGTPTEPHHRPSPEAQTPSHTTHPTSSLPPVSTTSIPTVTPTKTTPIKHYTRRTRIAQSSVSQIVADEPDRATIAKSSTLPYDSAPRVTSPAAGEGSMQHIIPELTALCTSLQRQLFELTAKFQAQEVEINRLKERVKLLEDREGVAAANSRDDAPIKGRSMDEGEAVVERVSDDTEEMATVLTSMDATTVLASGVVNVPTGSGSIPTASTPPEGCLSSIFHCHCGYTGYKKKGKRSFEQLAREDQRRAEQIARDAEIARIHAEEELQSMIEGLDSNNETVAKYLEEYHQFSSELHMERKIELIVTWRKVEAKFNSVCKQMEDFIPMGSKEEAERIKRKGINLEQESTKKQKSSEEIIEEAKSPEEDYPLRKGLALVMICYKLQVENFSQMENDLVLKIYKIANSPRQQGD
nr:hypothetical protein [Tanacetum cinerariifolium]